MNNIMEKKREDDYWVYPKLSKYLHSVSLQDISAKMDILDQKTDMDSQTNLYIHIPFCESRCLFCPYYKVWPQIDQIENYIAALIKELEMYKAKTYFDNRKIASVHFGGGNPFALTASQIKRILNKVIDLFGFQVTDDNVSIEGSVISIQSKEYVQELMEMGIFRFSLGIQTFDESIRHKMTMKAELDDIYRCVSILNEAGFSKYCFDMMYNMPDQTEEIFLNDLEKCNALNPYHIDIYNMGVFPNTLLDRNIQQKKYSVLPSNERSISMYKIGKEWFLRNQYKQIMTQTFSKYESVPELHDYLYLKGCNVLGIGCSSRGYLDGIAYKNTDTYKDYMEKINADQFPILLMENFERDEMEDRKMIFFPILMGINMNEINNYQRYAEKIGILHEEGLLRTEGDQIVLTEEGKIWSGNISQYFISKKRWNEYMSVFFNSYKHKNNPYNEDDMGVE